MNGVPVFYRGSYILFPTPLIVYLIVKTLPVSNKDSKEILRENKRTEEKTWMQK
jgi:hypothetical protein